MTAIAPSPCRDLALVVLSVVTTEPPPAAPGTAPELILHDAVVLTMDPDLPTASALAVSGDRIAAVGADGQILPLAGPQTVVIDLDGLTVTPGFIDSHAHWIGDRELYRLATAEEAIQLALKSGWTSIIELFVNQDCLNELTALDAAGEVRVRVNGYLLVNYGPDQKYGFWFSELTPGAQLGPACVSPGRSSSSTGAGPRPTT